MSSTQVVRSSFQALQRTSVWQHCKEFLSRHLLLVNTGTCTTLYVTGDLIQQALEGGNKETDWARSCRMAVLGLAMGPLNHGWYKILDRIVIRGTLGRLTMKKVLLDQMIMAPMSICVFFGGMCALEGRTLSHTKEELLVKSWPTYKMDWQFWPLAQAINFYYVPAHLRVTYVNIATLFWTVYLSYMKHKWQLIENKHSTS